MPTFTMPQLGESDVEGTVLRWLKRPGEQVKLDDPLVEVETEKVNVEIPSPFEGVLARVLVEEGETVPVGAELAVIGEGAEVAMTAAPVAAPVAESVAPVTAPPEGRAAAVAPDLATERAIFNANAGHLEETAAPSPAAHEAERAPVASPTNGHQPIGGPAMPAGEGTGRYSPAVLRLAAEHGIDLAGLRGTGMEGRVTRKDVARVIEARQTGDGGMTERQAAAAAAGTARATTQPAQPSRPSITPAQPAQPSVTPATPETPSPEPAPAAPVRPPAPAQPAVSDVRTDEEVIKPSATRLTIARNMVKAATTIPTAWMVVETDVTGLVKLRERLKGEFRAREGVDLSYLPFVIMATVEALKAYPMLNSQWRDDQIVLKKRLNIGIAVGSDDGLIVPVIHDADRLSIAGLAHAITDLATRARARKLRLEDVQGGTFTLDNTGVFGSLVSQPIINPPQCAILSTEAIVKRPVVIDDAIAIRSLMNLCISFDHRIVDGSHVGPFMQAVKRALERLGPESPAA